MGFRRDHSGQAISIRERFRVSRQGLSTAKR
jgi:hypothetical protein